jgi:putative copper resistance protein D
VASVLTHPVVALLLYIGTLYAFYFSGLFVWAMEYHIAHLLMVAHFVGVGALYFWPIIALDPMPRKLPPLGRMLLLFASMPFHAFFGVIVMTSTTLIGGSWYAALRQPWVDLLADQNLGGGIAWGAAEVPVLAVLVVVFVAWYRSDVRAARRADRRSDADLEQYNAMLARLATHDRHNS